MLITETSFVPVEEKIGLVEKIKTFLQKRKVYNQTLNELSSLSNRELNDLGIPRSLIKRIALESAGFKTE